MLSLTFLNSFSFGQVGSLCFRRSDPSDAHLPLLVGIVISLGSVVHLVYRRMRRLSTKTLSVRVANRQYRQTSLQKTFVERVEYLL